MATSWRTRQKEQLRQQLYDTALELFREQGYENTTVQQITSRAGVAKGTFFNHFSSKDQVVAEWHRGVTRDALDAAESQSYASAREAVMALMDALADYGTKDLELILTTARHSVSSDVLAEEEQSLDDHLSEVIHQHLESGAQNKEFAPDLDLALLTTMILTTLTGTTHEWAVSRQGFDFKAALKQRMAFIFCAAVKGDSTC